jgi:hypothetical protein
MNGWNLCHTEMHSSYSTASVRLIPHLSIEITLGLLGLACAMAGISDKLLGQADSASNRQQLTIEVRKNGRTIDETKSGAGELRVDSARLTVHRGDDVKSLLLDRGIRPDGHAIAWFYQRNPQVRNADSLTVGSSVVLPIIAGKETTSRATGSRVTYALVADTTYKRVIAEQAERIAQLTDTLRKTHRDAPVVSTLQANSERITAAARTLNRSSIPLSSEAGKSLSRDLREYETQVSEAVRSGTLVDDSVHRTGRYVADEASAHARVAKRGGNHRARLEFQVVDSTGKNRRNVRIAYVRPFYEDDSTQVGYIVILDAANGADDFDLGPWRVWVEDLKAKEISISRETIQVPEAARRPIILIAR